MVIGFSEALVLEPAAPNVTRLLADWSRGDQEALNRLTPLVYDELHRIASHYLRRERSDHTLQSTALVNEAFLRLVDQTNVQWQNRAHFFGIAARLIRQILVDHARAHKAAKRDSGPKLSLDEAVGVADRREVDLVRLDDALAGLASIDEQQARIVELRFFVGLTIEETAEVLEVSPTTIKREWTTARAWLFRELSRSEL